MSHFDVSDPLRRNARRMRQAMTEGERKLWNELRAHRLMGLGFRRQMPIAGYIVDFACAQHRLIVEVDGAHHGREEELRRDEARTKTLEALGWSVLRFWNDEVMQDIDGVCSRILRTIGLEKFP